MPLKLDRPSCCKSEKPLLNLKIKDGLVYDGETLIGKVIELTEDTITFQINGPFGALIRKIQWV